MQTLELNKEQNTNTETEKGFWRRQFQPEATFSQKKFDWGFGVILPVICFVCDPTVFKGGFAGAAILGDFKPFACILSFASVMAMAAWLIWGEKLKWMSAILSGFFAFGAMISLAVGIVLTPYSLLGLIIIIGVLGFTPLLTSIVFLRNSLRAYQSAKPFLQKKLLINVFVLSTVLSFVFPAILNLKVKEALREIKIGNAQTIRVNTNRLKYVAPLVNFDALAIRYYSLGADTIYKEERNALAESYKKLTGEDVERKASLLMD